MSRDPGDADLAAAYRHSRRHRRELHDSALCGCFLCGANFVGSEIVDWADAECTARCPRCGADAVIGDRSGHPVNDRVFLQDMHNEWFGN